MNDHGTKGTDACVAFFIELDLSDYPLKELEIFAYDVQLSEEDFQSMIEEYERFDLIVDRLMATKYWQNPEKQDLKTYFTSSFLHGGLEHLAFNLIFFFAFAVALEQTIGSLLFVIFCAISCLTIGYSYDYGFLGYSGGVLPTIGLSGIVMAVMGFVGLIYPLKKVSVFYWIIIPFGVFKLPLIAVVAFYVVSDLYGLQYLMDDGKVDYLSHVVGAFTGFAFGVLYHLFFKVQSLKNSA